MTHRVLVITRNLPPLVGGMERLIWHITEALSKRFSVCVIGPKGCRRKLSSNVQTIEVPASPAAIFLIMANLIAIWKAISFRPHLVLSGSGFTAPMAWGAAQICDASCMVYLHGLDIEFDHPLYSAFWKPIFKCFDRVLVNSHFTEGLAMRNGVRQDNITILHPGVHLPDESKAIENRKKFRDTYGLNEKPVLLYVGRITARKGLFHFVDRIFPKIVETIPNARLVVVGDEPVKALLKNVGEKGKVRDAIDSHNLNRNVVFLGERSIDDPDISAAYFAADVHIFPVQERESDNEGFGMVALEAAAHGLPTVAFATGGVPDAVKSGVSGWLINRGPKSDDAFAEAVIHVLSKQADFSMKNSCRSFAQNFEWALFGERIQKLIQQMN